MKVLTTNTHLNGFMQATLATDAQRKGSIICNENDQMDIRQASEVSDCCGDDIGYSGLHTYCVRCGESCHLVVRQSQ